MGALAIVDGLQELPANDFRAFAIAGRRLLSPGWADVFDDPLIQVGPIHLLFNGLVDIVAELVNLDAQVLLSLVVQVGYVLGVIWTSRLLLDLHDVSHRPWVEMTIAAAAVALTLPWAPFATTVLLTRALIRR